MSGNPRRVRVASAIRSLLAEMLEREVKDPRIRAAGFISINHVELNSDMSVARIYVSFSRAANVDEPSVSRAMAGLRGVAGYLRGPVGRRLRLRHSPSLRFVADDSLVFAQRLHELVRDDDARSQPGSENDEDSEARTLGTPEPGETPAGTAREEPDAADPEMDVADRDDDAS